MATDRTIFDEPHHQSLELLATQALANGDISSAFKLADRRCRIPPEPEPHCFVLRGEALYRLGAKGDAIEDLEKALQVAPDDLAANRRMLAWGNRLQQSRAAKSLLAQERNYDGLRSAIKILLEEGQKNFANVTVLDDAIEGWAVWENDEPLEISVTDDTNVAKTIIGPDPFHPLGDCGYAAGFHVGRPRAATAQSIRLSAGASVVFSASAAANEPRSKYRVYWPRTQNARGHQTTVIVPVYGDYDATRLCLTSLLDELRSSGHRAILVNDATPDSRIANHLNELQSEPCINVLVNARNLGFAGATNRGLEHSKQGDVILLNADTIVPIGVINRLAIVARSSPDIGVVMPLSNHGFPTLDAPIGTREEIQRIDTIASKTNAQKIIDIPSAIGFCLYITRACLNAVGLLNEEFGRGYYEDADFSMRAREHGFRIVCAPSVYIGHAGAMSFGQQKRSLVVRNRAIIDRRYPNYRAEWAAFIAADPLRPAREAIELEAATFPTHPRLLVTGDGVVSAIANDRARTIVSEAHSVLILETHYRSDGARIKMMNFSGGMPQSVRFNLSHPVECEKLFEFVKGMCPSGIEFLDPSRTPIELVDLLRGLGVPYDIFIADGGLFGQSHTVPYLAAQMPRDSAWIDRWLEIAGGAASVLVPSANAGAFAASYLPRSIVDKFQRLFERETQIARDRCRKRSAPHFGFVSLRSCVQEQLLMSQLTQRLKMARPDLSITVLGKTVDAIDLMRGSKAFVTGAVEAPEFSQLVDSLGVSHLFVATTAPLFGHPILAAVFTSGLPTAYFDWSKERLKSKRKDLPIDPRASLDDVLALVHRWLAQP